MFTNNYEKFDFDGRNIIIRCELDESLWLSSCDDLNPPHLVREKGPFARKFYLNDDTHDGRPTELADGSKMMRVRIDNLQIFNAKKEEQEFFIEACVGLKYKEEIDNSYGEPSLKATAYQDRQFYVWKPCIQEFRPLTRNEVKLRLKERNYCIHRVKQLNEEGYNSKFMKIEDRQAEADLAQERTELAKAL